jgi:hypothetical protein
MTRRLIALLCLSYPLLAAAQSAQLNLPSFADLQSKSIQTVDLTIGASALGFVSWLMDDSDPQDAQVKRTLQGLKAVQIRSYRFATDFVYPQAQIEAVRSQLRGEGWSSLAKVRDRNSHNDVDVYVDLDASRIKGLAIIACEPRAFTLVNIVGEVDLDQFDKLRGALGLPDVGIERLSLRTP